MSKARELSTIGISNTNTVKINHTDVTDNEYARFTAEGLESMTPSEVLNDLDANLKSFVDNHTLPTTAGLTNQFLKATDNSGTLAWAYTAQPTYGIVNQNAVKIDSTTVADDDYAKFTTSGVEGRSTSEVKTDLSLNNVENTALSTWSGSSNITTLGIVTGGSIGSGFGTISTGNSITTSGTATGGIVNASTTLQIGGTDVTTMFATSTQGSTADSAVQPNTSPTLTNLTLDGYLRGPSSLTIDPATHGSNAGTVIIAGDLQVDGTTTTLNSTTVTIDDKIFSIATDSADSAAANASGITIGGAGATMLYTHATTSWDFNKPIITSGTVTATGGNSTEWNTAYGWGNHASAGYLTSETSHSDVVVDGDFSSNGIMTRSGAGAYTMLTDNSSNWNTAYGWGDHSTQGYITTSNYVPISSPTFTGTVSAPAFDFTSTGGPIYFGSGTDDYLYLQDVGTGSNSLALVQDSATKFSIQGSTGNATFAGQVIATNKIQGATVSVDTNGGFYLIQASSKSSIRSESQPIVLQTYESSAWQDRFSLANSGPLTINTGTATGGSNTANVVEFQKYGMSAGSAIVAYEDANGYSGGFVTNIDENTGGGIALQDTTSTNGNALSGLMYWQDTRTTNNNHVLASWDGSTYKYNLQVGASNPHVGINTSSPDANNFGAGAGILTVASDTGSAKTAMLNLVGDGNDTDATRVASLFYNDASAVGAGATLAGIEAYRASNHATDPGADLLFSTNSSGGAYSEKMRIGANGDVTLSNDLNLNTSGGSINWGTSEGEINYSSGYGRLLAKNIGTSGGQNQDTVFKWYRPEGYEYVAEIDSTGSSWSGARAMFRARAKDTNFAGLSLVTDNTDGIGSLSGRKTVNGETIAMYVSSNDLGNLSGTKVFEAENPSSGTTNFRVFIESAFDQNVAIGHTAPVDSGGFGRALDIRSGTGAAVYLEDTGGSQVGAIGMYDNNLSFNSRVSGGTIGFYINSNQKFQIGGSGEWGIGSGTPSQGNSGDVFTSGGTGSAPSWQPASGGASAGSVIALGLAFG